MIRGITIARKGEDFSVLVGPEVPFVEQRRNFRKLRTHLEGHDEVELWTSGRGRVKRYRFKNKSDEVIPSTEVPESDTTSGEEESPLPSKSSKPKAQKPKAK